jgi:hypothetical protein
MFPEFEQIPTYQKSPISGSVAFVIRLERRNFVKDIDAEVMVD